MIETHTYLMPDYFPEFRCKIAGCRHACCEGWPVSLSMENYYRLLGLDCRPELRVRLDCGMQLADHPTKERYAQFSPRWDGNCPMRLEDGRCAIHAELGEAAQPDVCRLYPRGVRLLDGYECSCANSCEGVLELFLHRDRPMTFIRRDLSFDMAVAETRTVSSEEVRSHMLDDRLKLMEILNDDSRPIPAALCRIGWELYRMQGGTIGEFPDTPLPEPTADALAYGLKIAEDIVRILNDESNSVRAYGEESLRFFASGDPLDRYRAARAGFESAFPSIERAFRHMLINHMFFTRFPYQIPGRMQDEFAALCVVYTLLRFLCIGTNVREEAALIDVCAALFRLVEHTDFDRNAVRILKANGCTETERLLRLIIL